METLMSSGSQSLLSGAAGLPYASGPMINKAAVTIASNLPVTVQPLPVQLSDKDPLQSGLTMIFQTMMTVLNQLLTSLFQEMLGGAKSAAAQQPDVYAGAASQTANSQTIPQDTPVFAGAQPSSAQSSNAQALSTTSPTVQPAQTAETADQQTAGVPELINSFSALTGNLNGLLGTVSVMLKEAVENRLNEYKTALASAKKSIKSLKSQVKKLSAGLAKKKAEKPKL